MPQYGGDAADGGNDKHDKSIYMIHRIILIYTLKWILTIYRLYRIIK